MDFRKIKIAVTFILLAVIFVSLFWKYQTLLIIFLILLAYILQTISPIKKAFIWYWCATVVGPIMEMVMINLGRQPWAYSSPNILGVPFWLFPLYGLSGLIFVILYNGIQNSKK